MVLHSLGFLSRTIPLEMRSHSLNSLVEVFTVLNVATRPSLDEDLARFWLVKMAFIIMNIGWIVCLGKLRKIICIRSELVELFQELFLGVQALSLLRKSLQIMMPAGRKLLGGSKRSIVWQSLGCKEEDLCQKSVSWHMTNG